MSIDKEYWLGILKASKADEDYPCSRSNLEFLSELVFDVTTYDSEQSEKIGAKVIEVVSAITKRETFEYIRESEENYTWFLMVCNLPFVINKIEWGSSIRGAWWDRDIKLYTTGLIDEKGEQKLNWEFDEKSWPAFMLACIEFSGCKGGV